MLLNDLAIQALYGSIKDRLPEDFSYPKFLQFLSDGGWTVYPVYSQEDIVGGVMIKDNEIHVGTLRSGMYRKEIRKYLKPLIEEYGAAMTRVSSSNTRGLEFCHRLGFITTQIRDGVATMICTGVNHALA